MRDVKSGFTLIEILVALVIVGILVGTAVVSFGAGVKSAQIADATRVVQQYCGHARAIALLKQRPVVLKFEEVVDGGTFVMSRITATYGEDAKSGSPGASGGAGFGISGSGGTVTTLSGVTVAESSAEDGSDDYDPLSSEPREFPQIHVRGVARDEMEERRSRISVFSTADLLLRKQRERDEAKRAKKEAQGETVKSKDDDVESLRETDEETMLTVVFEPNGRCDPFKIRIWKDGVSEDKALELEVNRFGKVKTDDED